MSDSFKQQRQSYQATIERALGKLKTAMEYHSKFQRDINHLSEIIKNAQEKLDKLPPIKFQPSNNGNFFPNINYKDIYTVGHKTSFETAERMAIRGLRCESEADARNISRYLVVIGKIANYAQQANKLFKVNHPGEDKNHCIIWTDIDMNGLITLKVTYIIESVLPVFYHPADAQVVLDLLTNTEKNILINKGNI